MIAPKSPVGSCDSAFLIPSCVNITEVLELTDTLLLLKGQPIFTSYYALNDFATGSPIAFHELYVSPTPNPVYTDAPALCSAGSQ